MNDMNEIGGPTDELIPAQTQGGPPFTPAAENRFARSLVDSPDAPLLLTSKYKSNFSLKQWQLLLIMKRWQLQFPG
jgi:hypothetical protein